MVFHYSALETKYQGHVSGGAQPNMTALNADAWGQASLPKKKVRVCPVLFGLCIKVMVEYSTGYFDF